MKQLAPNTMIQNRYLVVHPIGKGGMGEVYLAVDQRLGSAVALKRTRFESDSELGTAFEREAKILARLRHPVLPKVIDHFIENDGQFLVMEHISGDDIAKRLESAGKPFPLSWAMFWADQLLDALNYLHSHEPPIVHRDIKPQNLKLTDDNHIVLLDFGLSKDFESVNTGGSGGVGSIVGYSPGFAPMEQVRGTGTDARSDIYSLSATLYQLLSNAVPADALTRADALLGGANDPVRPLDELNSEVPAGVSQVILKGMAIRQEERFGTAGEMQKSLRRAFNQSKAAERVPDAVPQTFVQSPAPDTKQPEPVAAAEPKAVPVSSTMDATVRMQESELVKTEVKQSDVATAIINAGDMPNDVVQHSKQPESAGAPQPQPEPHPSPTRSPQHAKAMAAGAGAAAAAVPNTRARSSASGGSRKGLLIGGLLGLLVLGGAAAGGGWYAYTQLGSAPTETPRPTAQPTPASPVEAANTAADSNTNTAVAETLPVETADPSAANAATNTRSGAQQPGRETPGKATTPGTKTPAKPKRKDDRTIILQ